MGKMEELVPNHGELDVSGSSDWASGSEHEDEGALDDPKSL